MPYLVLLVAAGGKYKKIPITAMFLLRRARNKSPITYGILVPQKPARAKLKSINLERKISMSGQSKV